MPIDFQCLCGRRLRAKDGSAGRMLDCPGCKQRVEIPAPDAIDLGIKIGDDDPTGDPDFSNAYPVAGPSPAVRTRSRVAHRSAPSRPQEVTVVDFDMPFLSLVGFLIKFELASVVAMILLGLTFGSIVALLYLVLFLFSSLFK